MHNSTETTDITTTDLVDVGHLGLFFINVPGEPPELNIFDGDGSIRIGDTNTIRALAAALQSVALAGEPSLDVAAVVEERERATAAAQETDCGVPGCDRTLHMAGEDPGDWAHLVLHREHLGMELDIVQDAHGQPTAHVYLRIENREGLNAEDLRGLATRLQLQAAALLEDADILERRARRVHRTTGAIDGLRDLEG